MPLRLLMTAHLERREQERAIPWEVRQLQLVLAATLTEDIVLSCTDEWLYRSSLTLAQRLHAHGVRCTTNEIPT